jgi:hypothetical protein
MNTLSHRRALLGRASLSLALLGLCAAAGRTQSPGEIVAEQKLSDTAGGFTGDLGPFDNFGTSITSLGDLNGDGVTDLAVGASHNGDGNPLAGSVWVLFMKADGTVGSNVEIAPGQLGLTDLNQEHHFGAAVAFLGDLDGDGVGDLVVGAPRDDAEDAAASKAGALWILFLNADGTVDHHTKLSDQAFGAGGPGWFDGFGTSVSALGDLDGDGAPDLAAGSPTDSQGGPEAGAVWIAFLKPDGTVKAHAKITEGQAGLSGSLPDGGHFGRSVGAAGDIDGDGRDELAVGAPLADGGRGRVWLLSLLANGLVSSQIQLGEGLGGFAGDLDPADHFGHSVNGIGDLDGDGVRDLVVGAPGDDDGAADAGAAWLLLLADNGAVSAHIKLSQTSGGFTGPIHAGDDFGTAAALVEPFGSGDDVRLALGAGRDDDGGNAHGAVWVLTLQGPEGVPDPEKPNPYATVPGSFEGIPGRPALVLVPLVLPGDGFIKVPLTVTPHSDTSGFSSSTGTSSGSGDSTITEEQTYSGGGGSTQAATADVNNDGAVDVVTSNRDDNTVTLSTGAFADSPNLVFNPPTAFALPFDGAPVGVVIADFDLDTDPDLAVAGNAGVTFFRNDALFSGNFVAGSFTAVPFLTDVEVGDVNGDQKPDLVTASGKAALGPGQETGFATVLLGAGNGSFTNAGTFATGRAVASVLLGKFDAGGTVDALLAIHAFDAGTGGLPQGTLELFLGNGAGGFAHSSAPWSLEGVPTLLAGFAQPNSEAIHPHWGGLADLNLDGRLDAVFTSSDSVAFPKGSFGAEQPPLVLTVLTNNGAGGFDVHEQGTGYVGRGTTPLLADFFAVTGETGGSHPDCMLVWHQDLGAGTPNPGANVTFLAALLGDSEGHLIESSPNQFVTGEAPGDPGLGDFDVVPTDGSLGHLDVLVPNMTSNSLSLLMGDGAGGVLETNTFADVDELDPGTLPHGGLWAGGPRSVFVARLNNDDLLDAASYNLWEDLLGQLPGHASVSIYTNLGAGELDKTQYLTLPVPGEVMLADVDNDSLADLLALRETGGVQDELAIYHGLGNGTVSGSPELVAVPAGHALAGGLDAVDVDGDLDSDVLTTTTDGQLLVFVNGPSGFTTPLFDLEADWNGVRSLDVGDVTGDHVDDVVIGADDGRLFVAAGQGGGSFAPAVTNPTAAAVGGGALRIANFNGDGRLDVVSSSRVVDGTVDQAFVRSLLGAGAPGSFAVQTLPALSSVGPLGALRPAVGDLNEDGATDLVLAHGDGDTISIHLNELSAFETYGAGLPGTGGIVPKLTGKGYTTPGGKVELHIDDGLGGSPALVQVGTGQANHPYLLVKKVMTEFLVMLDGPAGVPGAGNWFAPGKVPDVAALVGLQLTFQAIVRDPGAGAPAQGFTVSNGLQMSIVD